MKNLFDDVKIGIPCEECGNETEQSIRWIKNNSKFTCRCGTVITLEADQFKREIAQVERQLGELGKHFD